MVCEVILKDSSKKKYSKVVFAGVLGSYRDKLYIQTRIKGKCIETFIPLSEIDCYNVREPH